MDAHKKVTVAKTGLVIKHPFYGMLLLGLEETWKAEDEGVETCGVRPGAIVYNSRFIDTLTVPQLTGILAHEALHLGLLHPFRRKDRDIDRWNIACDHAVNLELKGTTGLELPEPHLADPDYRDLNAEAIYPKIREDSGGTKTGEGKGEKKGAQDEKEKGLGRNRGSFDDHPWPKDLPEGELGEAGSSCVVP